MHRIRSTGTGVLNRVHRDAVQRKVAHKNLAQYRLLTCQCTTEGVADKDGLNVVKVVPARGDRITNHRPGDHAEGLRRLPSERTDTPPRHHDGHDRRSCCERSSVVTGRCFAHFHVAVPTAVTVPSSFTAARVHVTRPSDATESTLAVR